MYCTHPLYWALRKNNLNLFKYLVSHTPPEELPDREFTFAFQRMPHNAPQSAIERLQTDGFECVEWLQKDAATADVDKLVKKLQTDDAQLWMRMEPEEQLIDIVSYSLEDDEGELRSPEYILELTRTHPYFINGAVRMSLFRQHYAALNALLKRYHNAIAPETIRARNIAGDTLLHCAAQYCNCGVIRSLLARGADVNAMNGNGETALNFAATTKRNSPGRVSMALKELIDGGAKPWED